MLNSSSLVPNYSSLKWKIENQASFLLVIPTTDLLVISHYVVLFAIESTPTHRYSSDLDWQACFDLQSCLDYSHFFKIIFRNFQVPLVFVLVAAFHQSYFFFSLMEILVSKIGRGSLELQVEKSYHNLDISKELRCPIFHRLSCYTQPSYQYAHLSRAWSTLWLKSSTGLVEINKDFSHLLGRSSQVALGTDVSAFLVISIDLSPISFCMILSESTNCVFHTLGHCRSCNLILLVKTYQIQHAHARGL